MNKNNIHKKSTRLERYINNKIVYYNIIDMYKEVKKTRDVDFITYFKFLVWASLNHPSVGSWLDPISFWSYMNIKVIKSYYDTAKMIQCASGFGHGTDKLKSLI